LYGPRVTISDLSAALLEIKNGKVDKSRVYIDHSLIEAWTIYCKAQEVYKVEKQTFLATFAVSNIETNYKDIGEIFKPDTENKEDQ
jgi:hypothetical protein